MLDIFDVYQTWLVSLTREYAGMVSWLGEQTVSSVLDSIDKYSSQDSPGRTIKYDHVSWKINTILSLTISFDINGHMCPVFSPFSISGDPFYFLFPVPSISAEMVLESVFLPASQIGEGG